MRVLIQRVKNANVIIDSKVYSSIAGGLLVFVGIEDADSENDIDWIIKKVTQMRIFEDDEGKMNRSVLDIKGELLVVSQFTLFASTKKGNRPSFIRAARPDISIPLYEKMISKLMKITLTKTGVFGTDMEVSLVNDGPVTIWLDSKNKE